MTTPFWSNDPTILFNKSSMFQVWPSSSMTIEAKMNAISRLVIILSTLGFIFTMKTHFLIIGAITLAIGIGIQNFPEGIAVSMPLRRHGVSRFKSFWYGQLSAIVEPVAGVVGALAVVYVQPILPFALAFAAGAMIFVVVEEVIPETQRDRYTDRSVMGFILGFLVMMILDVALG